MKSQRAYLEHILYCIDRIAVDAGGGREAVFASATLQDAILRNLQVLCGSAQRLDDNLKRLHPAVDWRAIAGVRNILVHDYFSIDLEVIWSIIQRDLPALGAAVRELLDTVEGM